MKFFSLSNLKKNNGHWGLSIAYIFQVVLQPLEWNKNLKDIQNKWDINKKNPYEFQFFFWRYSHNGRYYLKEIRLLNNVEIH
jgi:hypothetical protein